MRSSLNVTGDGIRPKDPSCPEIFPRYTRGFSLMHLCFSERDGEWLPHTELREYDEESDEGSDEESEVSFDCES